MVTVTTQGLIGAIGFAVAALVGAVVAWGRIRRVVVPRRGRWGTPGPRVWPGAHVDPLAVEQAVLWWAGLGHDVGLAISYASSTVEVRGDPLLDDRDSVDDEEPTHRGLTQVWQTPAGRITRAEVRVLPGARAIEIAHELGHALGYEHPTWAPSGHILHPSRPGWDDRGLVRGR